MAFHGPQTRPPGLVAGEDLTAAQYHFVKLETNVDNTVILCDGVTDHPYGVLQNNPDEGEEATVCAFGVTKVVAHADIDAGEAIGTAEDGKADVYTVTDTTKYIVGHVQEGASAINEVATVFVSCPAARILA